MIGQRGSDYYRCCSGLEIGWRTTLAIEVIKVIASELGGGFFDSMRTGIREERVITILILIAQTAAVAQVSLL
jgi:hypothetical protein